MSIAKVQSYVDKHVTSKYRKGYLEVLGLIQDKDVVQGLQTLGSIHRVSQLVGVGTNNRADNFPFDDTFLSIVEKHEQRAQLEFNKEYMHRIEELDKLRISDAVSQISRSLIDSSVGSLQDLKSTLSETEDNANGYLSKGSFEIPSLDGVEDDEELSSDNVTEFLSADSSDSTFIDSNLEESGSFLSLFSELK